MNKREKGCVTVAREMELMQGNQAIAEGAFYAGARFYAGYPITPSSEIAEECSKKMPLLGGIYMQMEDEIASMAARGCITSRAVRRSRLMIWRMISFSDSASVPCW